MDTRGLTYELRLKTYDALLWRYHALYVKEFARGRLNDEEFEKIKQMFVEACHMAKALLQDFVKRYDETETEDFDIVIERAEHWQIIHYTDSWKKMYQELLPTVEAGMLPSKDRLQVFSAYDLLKIPNYELAAWFILEKENGVTGKEDPKLLRKLSNYLCNTVSPYRNDFPGILFTTQAEFWHIAERHDYGDIHPDDWDTSVRYFFKDIMTDYMKARGLERPLATSEAHRMTNAVLREVIVTFVKMLLDEEWTDEWGVTYSNYGRILKKVDSQRFTCEEYTIPEGVEIMEGTFGLTNSRLRKIHLPSTLRKMEDNTFIRCPLEEIELPEGIIEVPDYMCESCEELEKVVLPSTIKRINHGAFNCCIKLTSIDLPDSIETIDCSVFRYCESLKGVTLPLKITFLGNELFYFSGIESIEIHKNITEIGQRVFCGCNNLKRLVIPESVISIKDGIVSAHDGFEGVTCYAKSYHVENEALIDDEHQELLCCWTQQKNYIVPGCVKRIADFSCNPFVETITVKQPVILTGSDIFASDTNLKRVDFQGGVTGLTQQTYWNCPKLENK